MIDWLRGYYEVLLRLDDHNNTSMTSNLLTNDTMTLQQHSDQQHVNHNDSVPDLDLSTSTSNPLAPVANMDGVGASEMVADEADLKQWSDLRAYQASLNNKLSLFMGK